VVKKEKRKKIPLQENLKEQNSTVLNLCFYCLPLPFLTLSNLTTVLFRKMSKKDVIEKQKHQIHLKKKRSWIDIQRHKHLPAKCNSHNSRNQPNRDSREGIVSPPLLTEKKKRIKLPGLQFLKQFLLILVSLPCLQLILPSWECTSNNACELHLSSWEQHQQLVILY